MLYTIFCAECSWSRCLSQQLHLCTSAAGEALAVTIPAGLHRAIASWTFSPSSSWLLLWIVTVSCSQGWFIFSRRAPSGPQRGESPRTQIETYVYWADSKHLVRRQQSKKSSHRRTRAARTHPEWELMKLCSAFHFHNPMGMLISCGPLTAKTHRCTQRGCSREGCVGREEFSGCLLFYDVAGWMSLLRCLLFFLQLSWTPLSVFSFNAITKSL